MTAVRAGLSVEFERLFRSGQRQRKLRFVQRNVEGSSFVDVPVARTWKADGDEIERESARDKAGELHNCVRAVGRQQNVAAQIEQAGKLALPAHGLLRS